MEATTTTTTCKSNRLIGAHCLCQCRRVGSPSTGEHDEILLGHRLNQQEKRSTHVRPTTTSSHDIASNATGQPLLRGTAIGGECGQFHHWDNNGFTKLHSWPSNKLRNHQPPAGRIACETDLVKFGHSTNKRWPQNGGHKSRVASISSSSNALKQHHRFGSSILLLLAHLMALVFLLSQSGLLALCEEGSPAQAPNTISVASNPIPSGLETARSAPIGEPSSSKVNDQREPGDKQKQAVGPETPDKVAPKEEASKAVESLQAAESQSAAGAASGPSEQQADKYAPPVNPADSSSTSSALAGPTRALPEPAQQPAAVQQGEDVPVVSGQDEPAPASQQQEQNQQENANGAGQASAEAVDSVRMRSAENDVLAAEQQFGRKQAVSEQQVAGGQQTTQSGADNQSQPLKPSKGRSIKRAFAGHMGVFGRKRSQSSDEQQSSAAASAAYEQAGKEATRSYHYYYLGSSSTTARPSATRGAKLKSADFPDYREILVQPDQADKAQPRQQSAATESAQLEAQQEDQQRVEQTSVQVGEGDYGAEQAELQLQLQQDGAVTGEAGGSTATVSSEPASTETPAAPGFIRLSNIATINSTSGASTVNSSQSGEMKLMRIYVIDLDQKLVVGNNQPGVPEVGELSDNSKTRYDTSVAASAGQEPPTTPQTAVSGSSSYLPAQTGEPAYQSGAEASKQPQHATTRSYNPVQERPVGVNEQLAYTQALQISPESYVMLDRDSLQANLSRMFAGQAQNYSKELVEPEQHRFMTLPVQATEQQHSSGFMYTPLVVYDGGAANVTGQPSAQLSGAPKPAYLQLEQTPLELAYSSANSSYPAAYLYKNNNSVYYQQREQQQQQQQGGSQIAAVYPQPVQVADQRQVYQQQAVVPQYIAPQYKSGNPDKEYEAWPALDQASARQQQVQYKQENNMSNQQQQYYYAGPTDYNAESQASNYTSKSGAPLGSASPVPVQALARQQDKQQRANKSSNVYHHRESAVYQQPGSFGQVDATYRPLQVLELPAQVNQQQQQHYYQQQQPELATTGAHKVTTAPTSEQRWKPVDHLAPAKILRQQADPAASLSQPAQYSSFVDSPTRPINGYNAPNNDHDVVSLAGVGKVHIPAGYQLLAAAQQAASSANSGQQQLELLYQAANGSDGQHAPLNYRPHQPRKSAQVYPVKHSVNTDTNAAEQQYDSAPVYANEHRYYMRPTAVNDAPSQQQQQQQQVTLHQHHFDHPSLSGQQYNGNTSDARLTPTANEFNTASAPFSNNGHLNSNNKATSYAQMEPNQQQYGTGQQAAYGNPRQHKAQPAPAESLPADQSSYHSVALEAPRIPQTLSAGTGGYRQQSVGKQQANSAYMAVSGPALADGVYESAEELAEPHTETRGHTGGSRAHRKPQRGRNPGKPARPANSKHGKPSEPSGPAYYQQEQDEEQRYQQPIGAAYEGQRAPLAAVASYYRPATGAIQPAGTRGLLSWETISSVASGAAKRLPSLSSILAPFAGAGQLAKGQAYPTANYPQEPGVARYPYQPLSYTKSAHYDRDVSAFHRPYPLRHMSSQQLPASPYSDGPDKVPNGEQQEAPEAEYEPGQDLASSSSKDHSGAPESGSTSEGSKAAELPELGSQEPELGSARPTHFAAKAKAPKATGEGQESYSNEHPKPPGSAPAEVISDLAELNFAPDNPAPQVKPARRPKGGPKKAAKQQAKLEDYEQAAVLSSIEQELADTEEQPAKPLKPARGARRAPKKGPTIESLPPPSKGTGVMFSAGGLVEPDSEGRPRRPPPPMGAGEHLLPLNAQLQRPNGLSSVQIGQYRITPQTQLVQSIFEPSRQMIGSYFRQYIGQLGQLGR